MTAHASTEALLRARFGPEAIICQVGAIWMVHVDQPSKAEIQEREAELEQDMLAPEDCGCCDLMQPQAGDTLIYDGEFREFRGQDIAIVLDRRHPVL